MPDSFDTLQRQRAERGGRGGRGARRGGGGDASFAAGSARNTGPPLTLRPLSSPQRRELPRASSRGEWARRAERCPGARGLRPPELGLGQFRAFPEWRGDCPCPGEVAARARARCDSGGGTDEPGRSSEDTCRGTLPSTRRPWGLWERKEVGEEAWARGSSAGTGRASESQAGSLLRGSSPRDGPSDTAPSARLASPGVGTARGRSDQRGRGWDETPAGLLGSGVWERSRGRGESGQAAVGRYLDGASKSVASRRRSGKRPSPAGTPPAHVAPETLEKLAPGTRSWTQRGAREALGWAKECVAGVALVATRSPLNPVRRRSCREII